MRNRISLLSLRLLVCCLCTCIMHGCASPRKENGVSPRFEAVTRCITTITSAAFDANSATRALASLTVAERRLLVRTFAFIYWHPEEANVRVSTNTIMATLRLHFSDAAVEELERIALYSTDWKAAVVGLGPSCNAYEYGPFWKAFMERHDLSDDDRANAKFHFSQTFYPIRPEDLVDTLVATNIDWCALQPHQRTAFLGQAAKSLVNAKTEGLAAIWQNSQWRPLSVQMMREERGLGRKWLIPERPPSKIADANVLTVIAKLRTHECEESARRR